MSVQPSRTDVYASIFTQHVGHTGLAIMMSAPPTFSKKFYKLKAQTKTLRRTPRRFDATTYIFDQR